MEEGNKSGTRLFDLKLESVPVASASGLGSGSGRAGSQPRWREEKAAKDNFVWVAWSDEVELLLTCTADYKFGKLAEGTDLESVHQKYDDNLKVPFSLLPCVENCLGVVSRRMGRRTLW